MFGLMQDISKNNKGIPIEFLKHIKIQSGAPNTYLADIQSIMEVFETTPKDRDLTLLYKNTYHGRHLSDKDAARIREGTMDVVEFLAKYLGIRVMLPVQKEVDEYITDICGRVAPVDTRDPVTYPTPVGFGVKAPKITYPVQFGTPRVDFVYREVLPKFGGLTKWYLDSDDDVYVFTSDTESHVLSVKCANPFFVDKKTGEVQNFLTREPLLESMSIAALFLSFREVTGGYATTAHGENGETWTKLLNVSVMPRDFSLD